LKNNYLKNIIPDFLGELKELKILKLDGNELVGTIPSSLANLSNLQEL
jgi:Leucine-rich repeat (LRR) protein